MTVTEENLRPQRKPYPSDPMFTINPACTCLGLILGLCGDRPNTNCSIMAQTFRSGYW